MLNIVS